MGREQVHGSALGGWCGYILLEHKVVEVVEVSQFLLLLMHLALDLLDVLVRMAHVESQVDAEQAG